MTDGSPQIHYPVLIIGAGPVGLSLAIELAYRGIRCLVVEQTDGSVEFPTTNLANTRTCEHLRRWGIADRMRYGSGYPTDYPRNYLFVTRMDGHEIARFDHAPNGAPEARSPYSPEGRLWISKPYFDPVLHKHAASLPQIEIRYHTSLESFEPDKAKVSALVVNAKTGAEELIGADYLAGCDGGRSNVRRALGITIGEYLPLEELLGPDKVNLAIFPKAPWGAKLEDVQATFAEGVLEVSVPLPTKPEPKVRTVEIQESAKGAKSAA